MADPSASSTTAPGDGGAAAGPAHPRGGTPLPPGATIGILGGGQLGRMLALAARPLGYRVVVLDPDPACPAAAAADEVVPGRYDDPVAAGALARRADVVTYELEHVGSAAATAVAALAPLRPGPVALAATQDRLAERRLLAGIGVAVAPWREVRGAAEIAAAGVELGWPLRVKRPLGGYDGRSQVRVLDAAGAPGAAALVEPGEPLLAEAEIAFLAELSVVTARDLAGRTAAWAVARNRHDEGILAESVAPAPVAPAIAGAATALGARIAVALDAVGVTTAELFLLADGSLLVNELAPRVHNSGHWTIEGAETSQFEQHIRAIAGLPLGATTPRGTTAVVNLLGRGSERDARLAGVAEALADPGVHLHLYGKRRVFERRKMGHVAVVGRDADEALGRARRAAAALRWEE